MLPHRAIVSTFFVTLVLAQQVPVSGVEYPESVIGTQNFTKLFGTSDKKSVQTWSSQSWNGLTTFAKTQPLRCFGEDAGVAYDVAVLGESHQQGVSA